MFRKITNFLPSFFLLLTFFIFPIFSFAQEIVNNGDAQGRIFGLTYECNHGREGECTFADLVEATKHLVDWATRFALGFSVIVIAYAGFKYMTSGGNPGDRAKANQVLIKAVIGIAFIIGAWLIVNMILTALGVDTVISFG